MNKSFRVGVILAILLALLPALASAEAPPPKGKLVYEDNFDSSAQSQLEDNLTATDFSRGFHPPGVYHLKILGANETQWVLFPNLSYANLSVQTDLIDFSDDVKAGNVLQGLVFRAQDNDHFYTVLLDTRSGSYTVRKLNGADTWSDLVPSATSPLIKPATEANTLRVDGDGGNFVVYVNDEELTTFKDSSFSKGNVGFIVGNVDANEPHMHFDNIKIYTTDAQPPGLPATSEGTSSPVLPLSLFALLLIGTGAYLRRAAHI